MKKLSLLLKIVIVSLLFFTASFNFGVDQAMATGQFSLSCDPNSIVINGSILSTACKKSDGDLQQSSIDLDQYIGNSGGILTWGDKDFSKSCKNIAPAQLLSSKKLVLVGECETATRDTYNSSEIELDTHLANINGLLKYE